MQHRVTYERLSSIPFPSASATECVRVLVSLGWMANSWTERECLMTKEPLSLVVPLKPRLDSKEVGALVQQAGIPPIAFVDALENIRALRASALVDSFDPQGESG